MCLKGTPFKHTVYMFSARRPLDMMYMGTATGGEEAVWGHRDFERAPGTMILSNYKSIQISPTWITHLNHIKPNSVTK